MHVYNQGGGRGGSCDEEQLQRNPCRGDAWKVWQAGTTKPSRMAIGAGKAVHKCYTLPGYNPRSLASPSLSERRILLRDGQ